MEEVVRLLPGYDYIFYGDSANNPYGEKSDEQLLEITSNIVDYLKERDCRLIVIACNTADSVAREAVEEAYPHLPVFGVVAPASRMAATQSTLALVMQQFTQVMDAIQQQDTDLRRKVRGTYRKTSGRNAAAVKQQTTIPVKTRGAVKDVSDTAIVSSVE